MSSILDECQQEVLDDFAGAEQLLDEQDQTGAFVARNVEFLPRQVKTRTGFGQAFNPNVAITTLFNWLQGDFNRLMYFHSGTTLVSRDLDSHVDSDILATADAAGMIMAQGGPRLYQAFYDAFGNAAGVGYVWDGLFTDADPHEDVLFQDPLSPAELQLTASEPPSGVVTPGVHNIAVILTTRNGFAGRPSPSIGVGLEGVVPLQFTSTGGNQLSITLTPLPDSSNWPDWVQGAAIVMTTVQNPNIYYFVPGATSYVPGGSPVPVTIQFNIDDTTLAGTATPATDYLNLLTGSTVKPSVVVAYSNRMVYICRLFDANLVTTTSAAFISQQYNPQQITADQNILQLPGFRDIVTAFVLSDTIYWVGPSWTYASNDNTDLPVTWVPPAEIDGRIGALYPACVTANSSQGRAWVAAVAGLFAFIGGAYERLPVTYYQGARDWTRINWTAPANCFQIVDDAERHVVYFMAPLDGATTATHMLAFDYTNGFDPNDVNYSLHFIGPEGFVLPGAIEMVVSPTTKNKELWVAKAAPGDVLRKRADTEDTPYNDDTAGIDSSYRSRPLPFVAPSPLQHVGAHMRLKGAGTAVLSAYTFDQTRVVPVSPVTLQLAPGADTLRLWKMQSESCSIQVSNGGIANAWWSLSRIVEYYQPWLSMR